MRTTLDLPNDLIEEGMRVSKISTRTALIIRALEELIRKNRLAKLKEYKGKVDLDINLSTLRDRS